MKWIVALVLALLMVTPAMAGQDPYISVVGIDSQANLFYFSPKYAQFMFDEREFGIPVDPTLPSFEYAYCNPALPFTAPLACERFRSQHPQIQPEVCDVANENYTERWNARVTAGNAGWYEWYVRLPKKPTGQINLVIQCGVLKPNAFAIYGYDAIEICAAETGELIGPNCSHNFVDPGSQPIKIAGLPQITAVAYPGPYNYFDPFNLTAYKNPSNYTLTFDGAGAIQNSAASQVLDGTTSARILLKACMDKAVIAKLPITGQVNALGQTEADLVEGDLIYVKMTVPRGNTVDVYCHSQSLKVMGIGEAPF